MFHAQFMVVIHVPFWLDTCSHGTGIFGWGGLQTQRPICNAKRAIGYRFSCQTLKWFPDVFFSCNLRYGVLTNTDQVRFVLSICLSLFSHSETDLWSGDAVTLWDLCVVWTALLCAVWDRKCLSLTRVGSITVALIGIILICQPDFIFHESHDHAGKTIFHTFVDCDA